MTDTAQLRALLAKMTQGRWGVAGKTTGYISCTGDPKTVGYVHVATVGAYPDKELLRFNRDRWDADAAGIVALVNAAPALLASAARAAELEAEVARLREAVNRGRVMLQHGWSVQDVNDARSILERNILKGQTDG